MFIVGRIIVYMSVGLVEVCVTTYQAEIVPGQLRGFVVVSLQLFLNVGSVLATGVNKAFSTFTTPTGWRSVVGIQFVFPTRESLLGWAYCSALIHSHHSVCNLCTRLASMASVKGPI